MDSAWDSLRRMRSKPPTEMKGAKRSIFSAALEQSERLWEGAQRVGPEAAPMLLFYSISQAGRAIVAALGPGADWRSKQSHGLSFELNSPNAAQALQHALIKPHGMGLFQQVSSLVRAEALQVPVLLTDLIAALPLANLPVAGDSKPALTAQWATIGGPDSQLFLSPIPDSMIASELHASPNNHQYRMDVLADKSSLHPWLAHYPRLRPMLSQLRVRQVDREHVLDPQAPWGVALLHPHTGLGTNTRALRQGVLDALLSEPWELNARGILLPALTKQDTSVGPLMTCWLILYAFSMLSRYYPEEWVALLDVDRSEAAVPLERMLTDGIAAIPPLLLSALQQRDPPGLYS